MHTAWINQGPVPPGDARAIQWSPPVAIDPGQSTAWNFDLASDRTHLADMDGDGLADLVHKSADESVFFFANRGRVAWGERQEMALQEAAPPAPFGDPSVRTADVDFDKRIDLIQSIDLGSGIAYRVWLNLGNYSLSSRKVLSGLPIVSSITAVRWADLNGNGTTDLVYADSAAGQRLQAIDIGQLLTGSLAPNTLTRINNGIGRIITIDYAPSTSFALADAAAGRPWPDALPFPVTVVSQVTVSDSLGHEYVTRFRYHDGYYDPAEKQFRGFAEVEQIEMGDETAPTLVSRSYFDTGRFHDAMKGLLLHVSVEAGDGQVFSTETTTWADPPRLLYPGTNGLAVRFAHPVARVKEILERGQGTARRLESEYEFDNYGNQTRLSDHGIVEHGDRSAFDDERVTVTEYGLNPAKWIIRLPKRRTIQDEHSVVLSRSESFYDDETFAGDNHGQVTVGNLTLRRDWIDPADPTHFIASARTRYDAFGNPVALFDPLSDGGVSAGQGHFRELVYDDGFHTYPIRETIHLGEGQAGLVFEASYDPGLATVTTSTDFNTNVTTYAYDGLARLTRIVKPYDSIDFPTAARRPERRRGRRVAGRATSLYGPSFSTTSERTNCSWSGGVKSR